MNINSVIRLQYMNFKVFPPKLRNSGKNRFTILAEKLVCIDTNFISIHCSRITVFHIRVNIFVLNSPSVPQRCLGGRGLLQNFMTGVCGPNLEDTLYSYKGQDLM